MAAATATKSSNGVKPKEKEQVEQIEYIPSQLHPPLTGKELLQEIKQSNLLVKDLAKGCGYVTVSKKGKVRVNLIAFYDAVLEAKGVNLKSNTDGRQGREASYEVSVHANGTILLGAVYTSKMGLRVGERFTVRLGHKHIHLVQIDDAKTDS